MIMMTIAMTMTWPGLNLSRETSSEYRTKPPIPEGIEILLSFDIFVGEMFKYKKKQGWISHLLVDPCVI